MSDDSTTTLPVTFGPDGLIPAVIQDATTGSALMVGFMNDVALAETRATGFVHFWSRSRQKLWKKGETSGHVQQVRDVYVNCEQNSLLIEVDQVGAVCHDGYPTCYYRRLEDDNSLQTVRDRWFDPTDVYGGKDGAAGLTARWWRAYEYLRDNDLTGISGTSSALHHRETTVTNRIADELRELAGVLDGSHVHSNQRDDAMLEAGQVCYWTAVETIRQGLSWDAVRPDRALDIPTGDAPASAATLTALLNASARQLETSTLDASRAHDLLSLVATACGAVGILPLDLISRDLEELRSRDYLQPYFAR